MSLSRLITATDGNEHLMPLSRSLTFLRKVIPLQMDRIRELFLPVMPEIEGVVLRYEEAAMRLLDFLDQKFTPADKLAVINRIDRNEMDKTLEFQAEYITKLVDQNLRALAGMIQKQGFDLFRKLKVRKAAQKRVNASAGAETSAYHDKGSDGIIVNKPRRRGPADTMAIEKIVDLLDQISVQKPALYYAAWEALRKTFPDRWRSQLGLMATHTDQMRMLLMADPVRRFAMADDVETFSEIVANFKDQKRLATGDPVVIPGYALHLVSPDNAVSALSAYVEANLLPQVREIRRNVRRLHSASASPITETSVLHAVYDALGVWLKDLTNGVFRSQISASIPLAARAQGDLVRSEQVGQKVTGAIKTTYTFHSTPAESGKSHSTELHICVEVGKKARSAVFGMYAGRALEAHPEDVEIDAAVLKRMVDHVRGEVRASTVHAVDVEGRIHEGQPRLYLRISHDLPVRRVSGAAAKNVDSLVAKTRAGVTTVVGSQDVIFAQAQQASTEHVSIADAHHEFVDTDAGIRYVIYAAFNINGPITRQMYEDARNVLAYAVKMSNETPITMQAASSRQAMITEFVSAHGSAKVRVEGGRALNRRVVVSHPNIPNRSFEATKTRKYGDLRKYVIVYEGEETVVSSADGWGEV